MTLTYGTDGGNYGFTIAFKKACTVLRLTANTYATTAYKSIDSYTANQSIFLPYQMGIIAVLL